MKIRAVAYARFSSDNQRDESIDAQLRAIHKYADDNGIEIINEYVDRAKTGTNADRESFQAMLKDSQNGDFQMVIVHKLDRFARNRYDSAVCKKQLKANGVRVVSVLEHFDDSPESIITEGLLEAMSEYYSANLSREVMKGMKENALSCKHTGGRPPLGYKVGTDMRLEIDENEASHVRFIFDSILNGMTYSEIISELNLRGVKTKKGDFREKFALRDTDEREIHRRLHLQPSCIKGCERQAQQSQNQKFGKHYPNRRRRSADHQQGKV